MARAVLPQSGKRFYLETTVYVENSLQYNSYRAKGSSTALLLLYIWIWNRKGVQNTSLQSIYRRGDGVLLSTHTHTHTHKHTHTNTHTQNIPEATNQLIVVGDERM